MTEAELTAHTDITPDEGALRAEARERVRAALPAAGEERT